MKLKTIKLSGQFSGDTSNILLSYKLGNVERVTSGRWELAISSIAVLFEGNLPWNSVFEISTNYVEHTVLTETGQQKEQMPLSFTRLKGNPNDKLVIGFKWRDFYEINSPTATLFLNLKEVNNPAHPPQPPPPPGPGVQEKKAYISVLLLLRRVE